MRATAYEQDLLRPIEERGWSDFREIGLADGSNLSAYLAGEIA